MVIKLQITKRVRDCYRKTKAKIFGYKAIVQGDAL